MNTFAPGEKLICIDNRCRKHDLTVGKQYISRGVYGKRLVLIECDYGWLLFVEKSLFLTSV